MKQVPLAAKVRTVKGSSRARRLRSTGFVPAEIYGHKETNQSIEVNEKELTKILQTTRGENIFFSLKVDGKAGDPVLAVVKEIQYNKTSGSILHADFHKVNMNEKIRIKVPLRIVNADICAGVKAAGTLQVTMRALEVQCLPAQIPEHIDVDVINLEVFQSLHVSDLKLPEGVKSTQSLGSVVASVAEQMAEEVKAVVAPVEGAPVEGAPAPVAGAAGEPEVLTAKKKEEGEAEAKPGDKKSADKKSGEKADKK
jgi:large subunit ribosomal protein L25